MGEFLWRRDLYPSDREQRWQNCRRSRGRQSPRKGKIWLRKTETDLCGGKKAAHMSRCSATNGLSLPREGKVTHSRSFNFGSRTAKPAVKATTVIPGLISDLGTGCVLNSLETMFVCFCFAVLAAS